MAIYHELFICGVLQVGLGGVEVVAILNDTTGTLVAGAHDYPDCAIGLILGIRHALLDIQYIIFYELFKGQCHEKSRYMEDKLTTG